MKGTVELKLSCGKTSLHEYGKPVCCTLSYSKVSDQCANANDIEPGEFVPVDEQGNILSCAPDDAEEEAVAWLRVESVRVHIHRDGEICSGVNFDLTGGA